MATFPLPRWRRRCPDCGHRLNQFNLSSFLQGIPGNDGIPGKQGPPGQAVSNQTGGGALLQYINTEQGAWLVDFCVRRGAGRASFKVVRGDVGDSRGHQQLFYNTKKNQRTQGFQLGTP